MRHIPFDSAVSVVAVLVGFIYNEVRRRRKKRREAKQQQSPYARGYEFTLKELQNGGDPKALMSVALHGEPGEWSCGIYAAVEDFATTKP